MPGFPLEFVVRDLSAVFKAYDIRGIVGEQLDTDVVRDLGAACARLVGGQELVGGHDGRAASPGLASAFATGAIQEGVDVTMLGLASTDMLYYASGSLNLPGAMFPASHNPAAYNGIKLCRAGASPV